MEKKKGRGKSNRNTRNGDPFYNHFASKEELVQGMYEVLREESKKGKKVTMMDYSELFAGKTAREVLQAVVQNYVNMNREPKMQLFYKVIYSERSINSMAAKIMVEETEKMILATRHLFYAMQVHGLLFFRDPDMSAMAFAMGCMV